MDNQQTNLMEQIDALKSKMARYEAELDYPKALEIVSELLDLGCSEASVICTGARYCYEMRNYRLAMSLVENALSIEPNYVDALILKGRILLVSNNMDSAMAVFNSAVTDCSLNESQRRELQEIISVFAKYATDTLREHFPDLFKFVSSKSCVSCQSKPLTVGFYMQWDKNSSNSNKYKFTVFGDELYANAMCRVLRKIPQIAKAELYAPNYLPTEKLDVMIYLNDTPLNPDWAKKHVLYLQNGYSAGSQETLKRLYSYGYNGYMFIANGLLDIHRRESQRPGLFLPFGVDTDLFYPRPYDERFKCEVAYVGNDIKGLERTRKFLCPALNFDFALYGSWQVWNKIEIWENDPYQLQFAQISRGKIPQEDVPALYSTAQININCTLQDCIDWDVITLRTFEVLACKGFLISDGSSTTIKELSDCVVFTDGELDMYSKIKYYLAHPEERRAYAERGYDYVLKHATIEARAKELVEFLLSI